MVWWVVASGVAGATAVVAGAFGAHALAGRLSEHALGVYRTGVLYHLVHALALGLVGALSAGPLAGTTLNVAGGLFAAGILLFSGSLYALALWQVRALGPVTPLGGLCFVAGWLTLVLAALRG